MLFESIVSRIPIEKGLSGDKKFFVTTDNGMKYLLRISDINQFQSKETLFGILQKVSELNIPMCEPIEFGVCDEGIYMLLTWIDGKDAEDVLAFLSENEQYNVGLEAGEILKKIHSISAPIELDDWSKRYHKQNDGRIKAFEGCGLKTDNSDKLLKYIEDNVQLLNNRPQCLQHGDYHVGNLMVTNNCNVFVIDWELLDFNNYADPWNEFNSIGLSKVIPNFTTGMLRGYFGGEPPEEFWKILKFYLSAGALMLLSWAYYCQQDELQYAKQHIDDIVKWYDNMQLEVPSWYVNHIKIEHRSII